MAALLLPASMIAACNDLIGANDVRVVDDLEGDGATSTVHDGGPEGLPLGPDGSSGDSPAPPSDAPTGDAFDAGPPPNAACLVPDKQNANFSFTYDPSPPRAGNEVITGFGKSGYTNVGLTICTAASATPITTHQAVDIKQLDGGGFSWTFTTLSLPAGQAQVAFIADPNMDTVYATTRVYVTP